jgi:hypothetical protein
MTWKFVFGSAVTVFVLLVVLGLISGLKDSFRPVSEWHAEQWMQTDATLPITRPVRMLALTDLPPLDPVPSPDDLLAAIKKSKQVGCNAAVLSFSWPALESRHGAFTLEELKGSVVLNEGRFLFLGIQVLNTTMKDIPVELQGKRFDDPQVLKRFRSFLDALAPLLRNRVLFLSIGNESDIYLSAHPDEIAEFNVFLDSARRYAKQIAPKLTVSTTLTDAGALRPEFQKLVQHMDAHFLTYYHGRHGMEGGFKDTSKTKADILALATQLDDRPLIFQEIGFPADESLGSPEEQAEFVKGVFDAWDQLGSRVPLVNYFMMYDFPEAFAKEQVSYYGVAHNTEPLVKFMASLGLHEADGTPRPSWSVFERRGKQIK